MADDADVLTEAWFRAVGGREVEMAWGRMLCLGPICWDGRWSCATLPNRSPAMPSFEFRTRGHLREICKAMRIALKAEQENQ